MMGDIREMYKIIKRMEVSGAHYLHLPYESKCRNLHGHNWEICVYLKSETLDDCGMVMDFTHIKKKVQDALDHKCINDVIRVNPTAENIARWIAQQIGDKCYKVTVQESEGNTVEYEV